MSTLISGETATDIQSIIDLYKAVRNKTVEICSTLEIEDYVIQTAPYMSPPRWHLGHTTWFFEMYLKKYQPGYQPHSDKFLYYFNSYYEKFGKRLDKGRRGTVSRPTVKQTLEYRERVDKRMIAFFEGLEPGRETTEMLRLARLGLEHETQHQELLVYDLKHLLCEEYTPVTVRKIPSGSPVSGSVRVESGLYMIGHSGPEFAHDNECPAHKTYVEAFTIDRSPVTNADYRDFIEDGGYSDYRWWHSEGFEAVRVHSWEAPLYWEKRAGVWHRSNYHGAIPIPEDEPVTHISYFEAAAYAKWAGKRLPSEAEWEIAARFNPDFGIMQRFPWGEEEPDDTRCNLLENDSWAVAPVGAYPDGVSPLGCHQMIGDVWEWTTSDYAPYPGFRTYFDEFNDKWFVNQKVLRGGSHGTPRIGIRSTYRNFFHTDERWMFVGLRCASDA